MWLTQIKALLLHASARTGLQLQQVAKPMEEAAYTDWPLPLFSRGLLRGEALGRYVKAKVRGKLIGDRH